MPRNTSVVLSDHFNDFITRAVESGRYSSASDVVRAGLRMLEENEKAFLELKAEVEAAHRQVEAGETVETDLDGFLGKMRTRAE